MAWHVRWLVVLAVVGGLAGCASAAGPFSPVAGSGRAAASSPVPAGPGSPSGSPSAAPTAAYDGERAPADFVALSDVDPTILQDIRYDTAHNFVGRPVAGYLEPVCLLTRQAAQALHEVQLRARAAGYSLKVYDCYRPQSAVDDFVRWAADPSDQRMKAEFYPGEDKSALFADGYIGGPTAHSRGATMDLTLVADPARSQPAYQSGQALAPCTGPVSQRFPDNSVDMGTGFDCFDPLAHTRAAGVSAPALANRLELVRLMATAGFVNYANEWWHYTLAGEPYPHTYFTFPVTRAALVGAT